jgi:tetratricopeptide (TPR) repeat protein
MSASAGRVLVAAVACLIWVSGCETSTRITSLLGAKTDDPATTATVPSADPAATGSIAAVGVEAEVPLDAGTPSVQGRDPYDDLSLGKKYFRSGNFGLAEKHFRKSVELHPLDAEAWVGLAASYDRLRRFELADRAYAQAARIVGDTPEIMNNKGFSYMLRGNYPRARATLLAAQARDPDNPYVRNNLQLLEKIERRGKSVN